MKIKTIKKIDNSKGNEYLVEMEKEVNFLDYDNRERIRTKFFVVASVDCGTFAFPCDKNGKKLDLKVVGGSNKNKEEVIKELECWSRDCLN